MNSLNTLQELPMLPLANTLAGKDKESKFMTKEFVYYFIQYANPKIELKAVSRTIIAEGPTQLQLHRNEAKPKPAIVKLVVRFI